MRTVAVHLGSRSYRIKIATGLLEDLGKETRKAIGDRAQKAIIISNHTIDSIYGETAVKSLSRAGFGVDRFTIGDGERFKSLRTAETILTFLIQQRLERSDIVVALGGGVVGDLAGFVAATYLRGIRFVQVPTTLLAQIDSSVGGKTGVNHSLGKNLIGAFHQPSLVVIDPMTLSTLPPRQIQAGLYEAIKYGIISDRNLFHNIAGHIDELKELNDSRLERLIAGCCRIKADVVRSDERESDRRRILNFGHTVGHALEAVTSYRRFLHGEAVGIGMLAASRIAERIGLLKPADREIVESGISAVGSLPSAKTIALDDIISAMFHDKKVESGRIAFVLPVQIGRVVIRTDVPPTVVKAALRDTLA